MKKPALLGGSVGSPTTCLSLFWGWLVWGTTRWGFPGVCWRRENLSSRADGDKGWKLEFVKTSLPEGAKPSNQSIYEFVLFRKWQRFWCFLSTPKKDSELQINRKKKKKTASYLWHQQGQSDPAERCSDLANIFAGAAALIWHGPFWVFSTVLGGNKVPPDKELEELGEFQNLKILSRHWSNKLINM